MVDATFKKWADVKAWHLALDVTRRDECSADNADDAYEFYTSWLIEIGA